MRNDFLIEKSKNLVPPMNTVSVSALIKTNIYIFNQNTLKVCGAHEGISIRRLQSKSDCRIEKKANFGGERGGERSDAIFQLQGKFNFYDSISHNFFFSCSSHSHGSEEKSCVGGTRGFIGLKLLFSRKKSNLQTSSLIF